ncbi:DNA-directed RNA polymerase subunit beta [Pseudolysinimonas kribbensis]
MAADFHKPAHFGGGEFEAFAGGEDPAAIMRAAHESARALLARARRSEDPEVVERLVSYTDEHGIDALAELWARSAPTSLPGALWRIYLVRAMIHHDPATAAILFQRGVEVLRTIDPVVAGAPTPAGPSEIDELADRILRGLFEGTSRSPSIGRRRSAGSPRPGRRASPTTRRRPIRSAPAS